MRMRIRKRVDYWQVSFFYDNGVYQGSNFYWRDGSISHRRLSRKHGHFKKIRVVTGLDHAICTYVSDVQHGIGYK
jgi:hypothetical protein